MQRIEKKLLFVFFIFSFCLALSFETAAQVKFTASASSRQIAREEVVQVEYVIENVNQVKQFIPPVFKNFQVLSGPNHTSGWSFVNGDLNQYVSISYILKPQVSGKFTLQGATATINGKSLTSNSITIEVSNSSSGKNGNAQNDVRNFGGRAEMEAAAEEFVMKKNENPQQKIRKNLFLKVEVDKKSCFLGEPLVATYKLYTRLKSESKVIKRPSFNGFSVYDMADPESQTPTRESVNGKEFNVYLIRKAQLYPLETGALQLEPVEVENKVSFIKGEYAGADIRNLGQLLESFAEENSPAESTVSHNITLTSEPVTILVKPLPDSGKPAGFNGAVGDFNVTAKLDKQSLAAHDMATLKILITGRGNLPIVNAPQLNLPENFEKYEPRTEEDLLKTSAPITGAKSFNFPFAPRTPGSYMIPAVEFSYFNPATKRYYTTNTDSFLVKVSPATAMTATGNPGTVLANEREESGWVEHLIQSKWIWSFPVLAVALLGFYQSRKQGKLARREIALTKSDVEEIAEPNELRKETPPQVWKPSPLADARRYLNQQQNPDRFYTVLSASLWNYFGERFEILPSELNQVAVTRHMKKQGFDETLIDQFHLLMDKCEWALYTPHHSESDMQSAYELAEDLVYTMESHYS